MPETRDIERKSLNWRGLTSLVVTLAFLVLMTTGVILYITPQGRVANWTGWSILGLGKGQWASIHITVSLLFIICSGFHIYFNWQVLLRYLVLKRTLHLKREMLAAGLLVIIVVAGTLMQIPPFSSVITLNDSIKAHWENRGAQAPYPHAEASTLGDFSERTGTPLTTLLERLAAAGITALDPNAQTIEALAHAHGLTPNALCKMIFDDRAPGRIGAGFGRQTLRGFCEGNDLSLESSLGFLRKRGFTAGAESTLKAVAEQKGMSPAEIRDLLVEKSK